MNENGTIELSRESIPFIWVAAFWLAISGVVNHGMGAWLLVLWGLCLLDLFAIASLFKAVFALQTASPEKHGAYVINASVWGMIKLACMGLFGLLLFRGHGIPSRELLLGISTMVIVPLLGGLWWSQKAFNHA